MTLILVVRVVAIDNVGVMVILLPSTVGALLALRFNRPSVFVSAALLTAMTAFVLLIGGVGLLYIPSIVLFLVEATRRRRPVSSSRRLAGGDP